MRSRVQTVWLVGLVVLLGSNVSAQQDRTGESNAAADQLEQMAEQRETLVDENIEGMSGQKKLDRAEEKIAQSRESLEETNGLLEKAREEEQDIQKINCINDKLAATKGFLKVAEQSYVKLKEAVGGDDTEAANHHYTLISVSRQKIVRLTEEARLCVGQAERYAEGTEVQVDIDEDIAEPDEGPRQRWAERTTPQPGEMEGLPDLPQEEALTPYR